MKQTSHTGEIMFFNSFEFLFFLPLVLALYWAVPMSARRPLLLIASYGFYGAWDVRFLALLALSTVTDFVAGRAMAGTDHEGQRRRWFALSLIVNLGALAFFKYAGFFVDSASSGLMQLGLEPNLPLLRIVLPVGISFYTFQTLSYTYDIYRRDVEPVDDFVTFAVYVSFFPQLVAGPIERGRDLIPRIANLPDRLSRSEVISGLTLIVNGFVKKVLIADQAAVVANRMFDGPGNRTSINLALGAVAFAIQIYGDFSGYTDIARGTSRLLGVSLGRNFTEPYLSRNITEFWRRWHVSLSSWLRDYLYRPLGGNRSGPLTTYRNLLLTMLLGGLWHGAGWSFVVWGALHGGALAIHRLIGGSDPAGPWQPGLKDALRTVATFGFVCFAWIFFRAPDLGTAADYVRGLAQFTFTGADQHALLTVMILSGAVVLHDMLRRQEVDVVNGALKHPMLAGTMAGTIAGAGLLMGGAPTNPFIYFQF